MGQVCRPLIETAATSSLEESFRDLVLEHPVNELWKLKRRRRVAIQEIIRTCWKVSVKGARYLSG